MSSLAVIAVFFGVFGGELKFILVLFSQKERKIIYKICSRTFEYAFFSYYEKIRTETKRAYEFNSVQCTDIPRKRTVHV